MLLIWSYQPVKKYETTFFHICEASLNYNNFIEFYVLSCCIILKVWLALPICGLCVVCGEKNLLPVLRLPVLPFCILLILPELPASTASCYAAILLVELCIFGSTINKYSTVETVERIATQVSTSTHLMFTDNIQIWTFKIQTVQTEMSHSNIIRKLKTLGYASPESFNPISKSFILAG